MKKAILIYSDWEEDIKLMTSDEAKNFMLNIFRNSRGEKPYLPSKHEQFHWLQVKRVLEINKEKYEKRAERSRQNGKQGGRPANNPTGY